MLLKISRFANTPKIFECQNISRIRFLLVTPKTAKSVKMFPLKYLDYTAVHPMVVVLFVLLVVACEGHTPHMLSW